MRAVAVSGLALLAMSVAALADPPAAQPVPAAANGDPFADEYANTLVETAPDGAKIYSHINEDHTWEQHLPDGSSERGTYRWQDDHTVCFTQTEPRLPNGEGTGCNEVHSAHKVGDNWTQKDAKGQTYTMTLVAGRRQ
jgi:hypothetical protein